MDIDDILDNDDLDIEIIDVKPLEESMSLRSPKPAVKKKVTKTNPVEEHLVKQFNCAQDQLDQTRSNIELIDNVTGQILKTLATRAAYREDPSSDSDSDLYTSLGEPVIKKKRNRFYEKKKVLEVLDVWQRVIDDKWVIGVVIESTTTCVLKEPTIYICRRDQDDNSHGVSAFWQLVEGTYWYPTEEIEGNERLVATVTLDLPVFEAGRPHFETHGTIFCEFDDKLFQTPTPPVRLTAQNTIDGSCAIDLSDEEARFSILALKAISIDRVVLIPVQPDSSIGKRLMTFLDRYSFKEVCKVCVARNTGSLQYCVLEVLPADDTDVRILISARSEAQLSAVIQLLRTDFPELLDVEKEQAVDEAAEALRKELQLYLSCDDPAKLQRARVKTDLLIP